MNARFLLRLGSPGRRLFHAIRSRKLRNRQVTVISNNCWGGFMHRYYGMAFNTPFIGLFMTAPDYIALLENPSLIYEPLRFTTLSQSRWHEHYAHLHDYPVGILPGGLEIHFMHYRSADEALAKWNKRVKRIDWNNAIIKFSDNDLCDDGLIERFDRLPFHSKVCFTAHPMPELKSVVALPEFSGKSTVKSCWKACERHWDFVEHANAACR